MEEATKECCGDKHGSQADSFCEECKKAACKCCLVKKHYEHLGSLHHRSEEVLDTINFLTKLKAATNTALQVHSNLIKPVSIEGTVKGREDAIRAGYKDFYFWVSQHKDSLEHKIRVSRYVHKLRASQKALMEQHLRLNLTKKGYGDLYDTLLADVVRGKYGEVNINNASIEELIEKRKPLAEGDEMAKNCAKFTADLEQLRKIEAVCSQKKVNLHDICRVEAKGISSDKLVFIKKNSKDVLVYYPESKTCESLGIKGNYRSPMNFGVAEIGNKVYIIGGNKQNMDSTIEFFDSTIAIDLEKRTTEAKAPMHLKRRRAGIAIIKEKFVYVIGGDGVSDFLDSCERYDPEQNSWTFVPSLNEAKINVSVGTYNDSVIYAFGGFKKSSTELQTIERLDTETLLKWEVVELSSKDNWGPIQNMGVVQIGPNEILLFGGMRGRERLSQSLIFKVAEKRFEKSPDMLGSDTFLQVRPKIAPCFVYSFSCHKMDLHIFNRKSRVWYMIPHASWCQPLPVK